MPRTYGPAPEPGDRFFAGLDLGQASDYTALAVLQRPAVRRQVAADQFTPTYVLRHCERFTQGTPYPRIVADVDALMRRPEVAGVCLTVDQTGVGRAVVDLFRERGTPLAVTITAGREITASDDGCGWNVPKKELVAVLQLLFQGRRIRIPNLPRRDILVKELLAFRVKVKATTGNETFEAWRERDHDDLVLAVALAAWAGEQALAGEIEALAKAGREAR